jgi:hypothetical protein
LKNLKPALMNGKLLLTTILIAASGAVMAQNANRAFAITGKTDNQFFWSDIREIDLATGQPIRTLFETGKSDFSRKGSETALNGIITNDPMGYGVAACALDQRHNRLYFTPMHFAQLRYVDLSTQAPQFIYLDLNMIKAANGGLLSEESHITRMVIGKDGYGYAMTNDAQHLLRFTTGKKPVVTDLGNIIDAEGTSNISIHNKCTSWGGDMLADAYGKLYVISANHHVFSIDPATRISQYLGAITGLPAGYTTNGAAVDAEGKVVVSTANSAKGYYRFSIKDLAATKVQTTATVFNASDMANANLLLQKEADEERTRLTGRGELPVQQFIGNDNISVFPNPVTGSQFRLTFNDNPAGNYTILLTDLAGRALFTKVVNVQGKNQVETVSLRSKPAQGMYLIKVLSAEKKAVFSDKLVVN